LELEKDLKKDQLNFRNHNLGPNKSEAFTGKKFGSILKKVPKGDHLNSMRIQDEDSQEGTGISYKTREQVSDMKEDGKVFLNLNQDCLNQEIEYTYDSSAETRLPAKKMTHRQKMFSSFALQMPKNISKKLEKSILTKRSVYISPI